MFKMKLSIALGLLVALFVTYGEGLQCWTCEEVSSLECITGGSLRTCPSDAQCCITTERNDGTRVQYWKGCKSPDSCRNAAGTRPGECTRRQGSVCTCCCCESQCNRFDNNCRGSTRPTPPTTTTTMGTTSVIIIEEDDRPTTARTIPPETNNTECFCQGIDEEWEWSDKGGGVECDDSLPNGYYQAGDKCTYKCPKGYRISDCDEAVRECAAAMAEPEVETDLVYVWKPVNLPKCVRIEKYEKENDW